MFNLLRSTGARVGSRHVTALATRSSSALLVLRNRGALVSRSFSFAAIRRDANDVVESGEQRPARTAAPGMSLYVGDIPAGATDADFQEAFSKFEGVVTARVAVTVNRQGRFGFVDFDSAEDAEAALERLGKEPAEINGVQLFVQAAKGTQRAPSDRNASGWQPDPGEPTSAVFIANIPYRVDEDELKELVGDLNGLKQIKLARKADGTALGFAILEFDNKEEATEALDLLRSMRLSVDDRELRIVYSARNRESINSAREDPRAAPTPTLYLNSYFGSEKELREAFADFDLQHVQISRRANDSMFAFMTFASADVATQALNALNKTRTEDGQQLLLRYAQDFDIQSRSGPRQQGSYPRGGERRKRSYR